MKNFEFNFEQNTSELENLVDEIKTCIGDTSVSKSVSDAISQFYSYVTVFFEPSETISLNEKAQAAKNATIFAMVLGQSIAKLKGADQKLLDLGSNLSNKAREYKDYIEHTPAEYKPLNLKETTISDSETNSPRLLQKQLQKAFKDQSDNNERTKQLLIVNENRVSELSSQIKTLEDEAKSEFNKISSLYQTKLQELESKEGQINEILGHVSGRAVAGDFEKSSEDEMKMANWLRYASLGCMVLIAFIVAYSFWDTTTSNFEWEKSLFRIMLAIMLSVPAAYLARESSKHREQQYSHLQTSLDLKAITPYIASLPDDEQHKIKIEVANRLFATNNFAKPISDDYPINMAEVVVDVIKKLDLIKLGSK